jgi:glutaredoxin
MKNVLFFSDRCEYSAALKKAMSRAPFKKDIYYIDVHNERHNDLIDVLDVTQVPTLFINGRMMVGDDAFDWLEGVFEEISGQQYGQPQYGQPQYGQPQYGQPPYGQAAQRAPPIRETYIPASTPHAHQAEFDIQPLNGDTSGGYSDFVLPSEDDRPSQGHLPPPVHARKNDKLDDGNMAQMLRQLEEDRRSGIPPSMDEQRALMTTRG